ncbi:tail fiber domain-containing protein [bacterium]|nr:tail fiber domain-containing protein [bacterium]
MKTRYFIIFLMLMGTLAYAQTPEAFKYQAVIGNESGEIIANTTVALRISVLQDSDHGTVVYEETFHPETNPHGLVDIELGNGSFLSIDWGAHTYFLKIEVDPNNGTSFTHLGTSPLLSVPYALHARTVQLDMVEDADPDPNNELQTISLVGTDLTLSEGGGTVTLPSSEGGDDWGTQVVESNATLSGVGTSGDPLHVIGDLSDNQTLSIVGNDLSILDGNTVPLPTSPWITDASNIYTLGTNVGIGTSSPSETFHVYGQSLFNVGTGTIRITTPGSYPGLIAFDIVSDHRRDIVFRPEGIVLTASTSNAGPGINDGIFIREGGNVGIQTASIGNYPLFVSERSTFGLAINNAGASNLWELYSNTGGDFMLSHGTTIVGFFNGTTGVYTPLSDRRVKTDIKPLNSSLESVKKMNPSTYAMKAYYSGKREIGLVAQEVKSHFPELVYETLDDKTGKTIYTVNYNGIAVVAVKAIQEQQEIIEDQSARIDDLEKKIEALQKRMSKF